jgi:hypothetical protein
MVDPASSNAWRSIAIVLATLLAAALFLLPLPREQPLSVVFEMQRESNEVLQTDGGAVIPGMALYSIISISEVTSIPVRMSLEEVTLFKQQLLRGGDYFEFGMGGSTFLAAMEPTITSIHAVESNMDWIAGLTTNAVIRAVLPKMTFHYVDINANPKDWGRPKDQSRVHNFPRYSAQIIGYQPHIVLIDGRFRVACTCQAILALANGGVIIIHDYDRESLHVVEEFLDLKEAVDTLAVFSVKPDVDIQAVQQLYEESKNEPAR